MMEAVYDRYGITQERSFQTIAEAWDFIHRLEEEGECWGIGVFDEDSHIAYLENNEIIGETPEDIREQKLATLKKIGYSPVKVYNILPDEVWENVHTINHNPER